MPRDFCQVEIFSLDNNRKYLLVIHGQLWTLLAGSAYRFTYGSQAALVGHEKFLISPTETYIDTIESGLPQVTR